MLKFDSFNNVLEGFCIQYCELCGNVEGVLIPQDVKGIKKIKSSASFILVVEKDAAFQKLLDDEAQVKLGRCILITVSI